LEIASHGLAISQSALDPI
jgi:hypothetical protein